jgi:hypothetical protein
VIRTAAISTFSAGERSEDMALIAAQKLRIAKLERQVYGQRPERSARLIDQLALDFEELEPAPRKTNWRRNWRPPGRRRSAPSPAGAPSATRSPIICRASGW